jgi:hypothetical protein
MDDIDAFTTEELEKKKSELLEKFEASHTCSDSLSIRVRKFSSGSLHHVQQCTVCGRQLGGPLGKAKASELLVGIPALTFDDEIETLRRQERGQLLGLINHVSKEIAKRLDPVGTAMDAEEAKKSLKQKQAAEDAIEKAVDAVGKTYLWRHILPHIVERTQSLAAKFKEEPKAFQRFTSEAELKAWLETWIEADFDIFKEVSGVHMTENVGVKIDYVLKPKPHLVDAGFLPIPVGLEVKYLPQEGSFSSRASRFVWQAVSYTDCQFNLPDGPARLSRVLLFSNMSFEDEYSLLKGVSPSVYENEKAKWTALLELANHANVGNLMMYGSRENRLGWKIKFAAGIYFSRFRDECSLHNAQLFNKIRIGNF